MDLTKLNEILKSEPAFRLRQVRQAIFINLIDDWNRAVNLPLPLREKLNQLCPLNINAKEFSSRDKKTIKILLELADGLKIESVLMRHKDDRNTVCLSAQAGCPLGCLFCATGKTGFKRNLTAEEIIEQPLFFSRLLKKDNKKISSVVFMGMGEPFLNYNNVIEAIKILNDKEGLNIGARHISISTVGVRDGIKKLAGLPLQVNLAVSLHASNNWLRSKIIPVNKNYPLENVLKDIIYYLEKTGRKVMIEYMMIKNFNDSAVQARDLVSLLNNINPSLYFINLISHNPIGKFKPTTPSRLAEFKKILESEGITVTERFSLGEEIKAACGQLAGKL